ncbi:unnamed protein product [Caenorhabditis sp. 36 PRJEB53466]|nr:unnamed protein product [Caenorhabditis sp. 36 PRJEB53466]
MVSHKSKGSKSPVRNEMKVKRIVYQMSRTLYKTDAGDDFQKVIESMSMNESDKKAGFEGFLKVQHIIKESLKEQMRFGRSDEPLLSLLTAEQTRCVKHMMKLSESDTPSTSRSQPTIAEDYDGPGRPGEKIVARKVKVVEDGDAPNHRIQFNIPRLDVHSLRDEDPDDDVEYVSSRPGRSSSRLPAEPQVQIPRVTQTQTQSPISILKKIKSRPRPIEKSDAQIQTDQVEPLAPPEKVDMADTGTNCRLLTSPKFEDKEEVGKEVVQDDPRICSPMSIATEISEGEVTAASGKNVVVVRSDGSIVQPEHFHEDVYFGDSESDILRATSSSPLRVLEVDMSISSTHSH